MRLFVALELNSKVVVSLAELIRRLQPHTHLRWVHPENMHLTLKYIGEWSPKRLEEVIHQLKQVRLPATEPVLNVPLAGLGFSPNAHRPRIFWAGAENTPALRQLASRVDSTLQTLGIAPEVRPYNPHLTLARVREDIVVDDLYRAVEDLPSREFGMISPDHFVLFESTVTEHGPVYRNVAEFPFLQQVGESSSYSPPQRSFYATR